MNELARQANSKNPKLSLDQMQQALRLKNNSNSKIKKHPENRDRHP
ncbi:hypothetical protein SNE26_19835 [Mucilaginibacter sp. cycad4]|nr:hypothetical protein [Mucilaginibacter gossypii]WPU98278.1 hypothetical protein SNE26_19835 [Mucilaginibacter gossypii]